MSVRAVGLLSAFIVLLGAPLAAQPQSGKTYRLGYVTNPTAEQKPYLETFRSSLRDLGYVEGRNLILDVRYPDREHAHLPAVVDELIALKPDALLGWESLAQVMRTKTTSIPIILTGALDPVAAGLAQSFRRPGMNVTGVAQLNDQLPGKHIEIMRQIRPGIARVGQLVDTTATGCKIVEANAREAARALGVVFVPYYVANKRDIELAFAQMAKDPPDVLLPCPSPVLFNFRDLLFESVVRLRIPLTSYVVANVPEGVLFAYAASLHEINRRAAIYVDKILKGANPAELPIEQPTNFELVVNLKTARLLGVTIPPAVRLRASAVIE
jgi:ABC-type uncharacterized transport system substrate-binding protein